MFLLNINGFIFLMSRIDFLVSNMRFRFLWGLMYHLFHYFLFNKIVRRQTCYTPNIFGTFLKLITFHFPQITIFRIRTKYLGTFTWTNWKIKHQIWTISFFFLRKANILGDVSSTFVVAFFISLLLSAYYFTFLNHGF